MRKPLVVGNWKMHGARALIEELIAVATAQPLPDAVEIVVCPPFVLLADVAARLSACGICLGAQNLSEHGDGAFTGEISARMLTETGCQYVIVGHSERRALMGETDDQAARKFIAAQSAGLTPILCVGETWDQRRAGETFAVVERQLRAISVRAGLGAFGAAVVAYEPVWAIGSGAPATAAAAQDVQRMIRDKLGAQGLATRILYGGSVKAASVEELLAEADIDGVLVGGASLDIREFTNICRLADRI